MAKKPDTKNEAYLDELLANKQNILGGAGALIFVFAGLIIVSMGTIAFAYYNLILETMTPQVAINSQSIGRIIAQKLSYATSNGVALQDLRGLQEFITSFTSSTQAIAYIVITDTQGVPIHTVNLLETEILPLHADFHAAITTETGRTVGSVQIYLSSGSFQRILDDLKYEMLTLSTIALFLSIDLLNSFYIMRIHDPLTEIFNHLAAMCRGKFTRHIKLSQSDEVNSLCDKINKFINKCNEKFSDFFYEAEETLNAQIDDAKTNKIQRVINNIKAKYKFSVNKRVKPKIIQSAMSIKIPLLIFVMGQELTTAFLPIYFRQLEVGGFASSLSLSGNFMVGLTFVGFLFAPIISMYFSTKLLSFFSMRSYLVIGAALCMATLYGLSQVQTIEQAILIRTINGLGYGLIFLGSQIHIARLSSNENRARGSAVFARTMYAAVFFCPVIGGILSEQLGYENIFVLSALICALSILAMLFLMRGNERKKLYPDSYDAIMTDEPVETEVKKLSLRQKWQENATIFKLAAFGSVPVKLNHFGIIMFIMPLLLVDVLGFRVIEVGRVLMLFGFLLLVCMPYVGKHMDKHQNAKSVMMFGSLLSLVAIVALFFHQPWIIIGSVALFGISQSMVTPALLTLVQNLRISGTVSPEQLNEIVSSNLTLFRLVERVGLIIGILLLSVFIGIGSYIYAFAFILFVQGASILILHFTPIGSTSSYTVLEDGDIPVDDGKAKLAV